MTLRLFASPRLGVSLWAVALGLVGVACDPEPSPPAEDVGGDTHADGVTDGGDTGPDDGTVAGWTVDVDEVTGAWSVTPAHAPDAVLTGPGAAGLGVAISGEPLVKRGVGSFDVRLDPGVFPALDEEADHGFPQWRYADEGAAPEVLRAPGTVEVWWPLAGDGVSTSARVGLRFWDAGSGRLGLRLVAAGVPTGLLDNGRFRWAEDPARGAGVFGLGTQVTGFDLDGRRYPLFTQEQGIGKPDPEPDTLFLWPLQNYPEAAYAPMGVWHSQSGWSMVADFDCFGQLDLTGEETAELATWGERPGVWLLPGATPRERVADLADVLAAGYPEPPARPLWTWAPWNDAVGGPERLYELATRLRDAEVPSSAIWSEDWIGGDANATGFRLSYAWEWDPETYPDLPTDIVALHAMGFAFFGYFNPFVPEPTRMFEEGTEGGWLLELPDDHPDAPGVYTFLDPAQRQASLVDLTDPGAVAWLKGYLETAADTLGIDGWMADFAEWLPTDAGLHSGDSGWNVHNPYPRMWQRANREVMDAVHAGEASPGYTFWVRSGWASTRGGTGRIAPVMWGGDQNTTFDRDDGLASVLPLTTHVGLSGVDVMATDVAGYSSFATPLTTKELFFRWTSHAALTPVMRTHHGSTKCGNWQLDRDDETLAHYRRWARVHMALAPMWEQWADPSVRLPVVRHPWLERPDQPELWASGVDGYFVGPDLWVAPVVEPSAAEDGSVARATPLPEAGWWPLFGDGPLDAPTWSADVALTELPAFVRPGAALVRFSEIPDTLYPEADEEVVGHDDVKGALTVALYHGGDGAVASAVEGGLAPRLALHGAVADGLAGAMRGGQTLPSCATVAGGEDCVDAEAGLVRLFGVEGETAVAFDGGRELMLTPRGGLDSVTLAIGADAWGEVAVATAMTALDPDIPPPCE